MSFLRRKIKLVKWKGCTIDGLTNGEFPNNIRANNIKTKLVSNNINMK